MVTLGITDKNARQKKKKRHHYIPHFYLQGFIDAFNRPYIWVYEKGNPRVIKTIADNLAVEKHGYSFPDQQGQKDSETFENFLADIEMKAAPVFRKIETHQVISEEERAFFALFLAFMVTRIPHFRRNVEAIASEIIKNTSTMWASQEEAFRSSVESFESNTGEKIGIPVEGLRKFIEEGRYDIEVMPHFSLETVLVAVNIGLVIHRMKWTFLMSTQDYEFVTCDNPVYRLDLTPSPPPFNGMGLLNANIQVSFPISKKMAFLGTWKGMERYVQCKNTHIKGINLRTVVSASRYVFASLKSDALNRLVQKYKDSAPRIVLE